jgi:DNA-binding transcriptional LysR family regulator
LQAAISAGLGIGILPDQVIQPDHRVLGAKDGLAPLAKTELALCAAPGANPATHRLAAVLADFCSATDPRAAA